ncbi:pilus assembly protein PilX [Chromobacterium sinusclupearum]|uniref:Pilus assembly protein PilX n=1 Tax=Chromobacterium sinusclupearum TaxID=2077146 RepID=A0A2K4MHZ7_9NEIS|nr:PilX N-terminal domain-containing pilus assembly protein [Chromobacterium sinusclupearum]POA96682.1 pilus assembly protein PilX [Chromobacterium sinusclupearum]
MKQPSNARARQHGFTLIAALMILIVITIIGLAMMRGVGLQGRMAGNFREKGRAFEAAQASIDYAEWWLLQNNNSDPSQATNCSATQTSLALCSNAIAATTTPWTNAGYSYALTANAPSISAAFAQPPQIYIQYLGLNSAGNGVLYQINTLGYGGNTSSLVVLQSTYTLYSGVKNLGK